MGGCSSCVGPSLSLPVDGPYSPSDRSLPYSSPAVVCFGVAPARPLLVRLPCPCISICRGGTDDQSLRLRHANLHHSCHLHQYSRYIYRRQHLNHSLPHPPISSSFFHLTLSKMTAVIEGVLGYIFQNQKGRDAKAFTTLPAFENHTDPTIEITSPDCGPTNATLTVEYTHDGIGRIPSLEWKAPENIASEVKEWLLVSEDPDAPLPTPICHG